MVLYCQIHSVKVSFLVKKLLYKTFFIILLPNGKLLSFCNIKLTEIQNKMLFIEQILILHRLCLAICLGSKFDMILKYIKRKLVILANSYYSLVKLLCWNCDHIYILKNITYHILNQVLSAKEHGKKYPFLHPNLLPMTHPHSSSPNCTICVTCIVATLKCQSSLNTHTMHISWYFLLKMCFIL